ncbi:MAG TPA: acyltransferase [Cytophagales bacterium]|nr:acyltransferase [Cytophagales bacterium]
MNQAGNRQYYLDWLRVIAFALLIFFHCAMPFVRFGWEIKNQEHSGFLDHLIWWMHQWRLPLLFFIAGVGASFSLKNRSVAAFAGERFVRLFVPLFFAMMFTTPIQVYFERLQRGLYSGSYLDFYPGVWNFIPYPDGILTWSHLWFVAYLFVFTYLLLPVFALFRWKPLQELKLKTNALFRSPWMVFGLVVTLTWYYLSLYIHWPEQGSLLGDWFVFMFSITLFFYGWWVSDLPAFWDTCLTYRWHFLAVALITFGWLMGTFWWNFELPKEEGPRLIAYSLADSIHIWSIILAALGFAKRHLNFTNPVLQYATPAVYPYYILHQTVIVASGYYVVQWDMPIALKLLVLIVICFGTVGVLYQFLIRRTMLTRVLYGLKPKEKRA